ncbi:CD166 antigen [Lissotriton helveticus]
MAGAAWLLCALLSAGPALATRTVRGRYNQTLAVPCGRDVPPELMFVKWKYEKPDGSPVFMATRKNASVKYEALPEYAGRLELGPDYALSVARAQVSDERRLVCMLVTEDNVYEEPTTVRVFKAPSGPRIQGQPAFLPAGELALLGECVAQDSYPEANLTWYMDGRALEPADGAVLIEASREQDPASRLHTARSILSYRAAKETAGAKFTCSAAFQGPDGPESATSEPATFEVHYPTQRLSLDTLPPALGYREGDNITLTCTGDGNPPPQDFVFYFPGSDVGTPGASVLTLTDARRSGSGAYKCGLANTSLTSPALDVTVHYLDVSMSPNGSVTRQVGEALQLSCTPTSSEEASVAWLKDGNLIPKPSFTSLQYKDAGTYTCEAFLPHRGLKKRQTLNLTVEGKPRLKVAKEASKDGKTKTVTCQVEGYPKAAVQWVSSGGPDLLNGTRETDYANLKFSSKLTISPAENATLTCIAENRVGRTSLSINVSAINIPEPDEPEEQEEGEGKDRDQRASDQAKLVVGIVVGLLLAALVAGVAYWFYSKKVKQGTRHTDKELGNGEENKALGENNHKPEA